MVVVVKTILISVLSRCKCVIYSDLSLRNRAYRNTSIVKCKLASRKSKEHAIDRSVNHYNPRCISMLQPLFVISACRILAYSLRNNRRNYEGCID